MTGKGIAMPGVVDRRSLLAGLAGAAILPLTAPARAAAPVMIVHRDALCGCCEAWVAHIRAAGIEAKVIVEADMLAVKQRLNVPEALASCHTAEIGSYVIEGHVPAGAVLKLLSEKPEAIGLSAPGMPIGSPGMETGGKPETYDVVLFGAKGATRFGRYRGAQPV